MNTDSVTDIKETLMKKIKHAGKTALALCSILALLAGCGKTAATNSVPGSMNTTSSSAGTLTALDSAAVNASSESGTSGTESTASAAGSTGSSKNESPDSSAAPAADPTSAPESPAAPSEDPAGIDFVSTETSLYTYEQMMTDLSEMAAAYPDLLTVRSCGTSLDGREIPEAILGNPESAHHILIQEVARRLGHASVTTTLRTYAHLYPTENAAAIAVLDEIPAE